MHVQRGYPETKMELLNAPCQYLLSVACTLLEAGHGHVYLTSYARLNTFAFIVLP